MSGYYAAESKISRDPIEGGIAISAEEYRSALDAMMDGRSVAIVDGALVLVDPPGPEPEPEPGPPDGQSVNIERDRRIRAGTTVDVPSIGPVPLQGRDEDARNLQALAFAASLRLQAGDTTTTTDFRDADNTMQALTPPQVLALWQGGAAFISAVYAASWAIKALDPIPADYADDARWPA